MTKYITFNCGKLLCGSCPAITGTKGCTAIHPLICNGECAECQLRFLCFTSGSNTLIVSCSLWVSLKDSYHIFRIEESMSMSTSGLVR